VVVSGAVPILEKKKYWKMAGSNVAAITKQYQPMKPLLENEKTRLQRDKKHKIGVGKSTRGWSREAELKGRVTTSGKKGAQQKEIVWASH